MCGEAKCRKGRISVRLSIPGLTAILLTIVSPALGGTFEGINAFNGADYKTAYAELQEPAKDGDPHARYYLGRIYGAGLGGVKKDPARAAKLYAEAADAGIPEAQYHYGIALSLGEGIEQDFVKSLKWFILAKRGGVQAAEEFANRIAGYLTTDMVFEARRAARTWEAKKNAKAKDASE